MSSIKISGLEKIYSDGTKGLDNVTMTVNEGEFFGLIGQNGAGKTTLINILTGQVDSGSGNVSVTDIDPTKNKKEIRSRVGILPEKESPPGFLTPKEYFEFVGSVRGIEDSVLEKRVSEWVDRLDMSDKMDSLNRNLSRGQQQKVLFAAAFLHEPNLVFIDEPLANLDPLIQKKLKNYLKEYNNKGNTIVLSTHYLEAATELCDKIGIMNNGKLKGLYEKDDVNIENIQELLDQGDNS